MNTTDPYMRAMFGQHAIHVPFNCIVQSMDNQVVLAVVLIRGETAMRLACNSTMTHQLIIGDAVIRPRTILESNHLRGRGLVGIATGGFDLEEWMDHSNKILIQ